MSSETSRQPSLASRLLQPTRLTKACHRRLPSQASCETPAAPSVTRLSRSRPYNKTASKHRAFLQCTNRKEGAFHVRLDCITKISSQDTMHLTKAPSYSFIPNWKLPQGSAREKIISRNWDVNRRGFNYSLFGGLFDGHLWNYVSFTDLHWVFFLSSDKNDRKLRKKLFHDYFFSLFVWVFFFFDENNIGYHGWLSVCNHRASIKSMKTELYSYKDISLERKTYKYCILQ